jgi:hypothetical protein
MNKQEYDRQYYLKNKEKRKKQIKEWEENNKDKRKEYHKNWHLKNKDRRNKAAKIRAKNNREVWNERWAFRKALKLQATPKWADLEKIKVLYEKAKWLESLTGLKYHVDHVIPLVNDNVCGLHCWYNLQILEASLNIGKGNRYV